MKQLKLENNIKNNYPICFFCAFHTKQHTLISFQVTFMMLSRRRLTTNLSTMSNHSIISYHWAAVIIKPSQRGAHTHYQPSSPPNGMPNILTKDEMANLNCIIVLVVPITLFLFMTILLMTMLFSPTHTLTT